MIRPSLSGAMEDCSIVRVQQLQMLYYRRCCMSASQRLLGSLWNSRALSILYQTAVDCNKQSAICL